MTQIERCVKCGEMTRFGRGRVATPKGYMHVGCLRELETKTSDGWTEVNFGDCS